MTELPDKKTESLYLLAVDVLGSNSKATSWSLKLRKIKSALMIMSAEAGANLVEETLN